MRAAVVALALLLVVPASASAHAVLEGSNPERAVQVESAPERVTLRFNEPVEVAFGSVRAYDARGERVDSGSAEH
ncbi:MAG: copper resistance CopC family protein, partial [Thermoleophilaceae bacterium]